MTTIDFGHDWLLPDGRRAMLCWHRHNGQLILHRPDGHNDVLATISDEDDVRARLVGCEHHAYTSNGLGWLAGRLDDAR